MKVIYDLQIYVQNNYINIFKNNILIPISYLFSIYSFSITNPTQIQIKYSSIQMPINIKTSNQSLFSNISLYNITSNMSTNVITYNLTNIGTYYINL
jgi:hypothetical protein